MPSSTAQRLRRALPGLGAVATLTLALGGCVIAPANPSPVRTYGPTVVYTDPGYVTVPPPPPQTEVIGPPPVVGWVWITGFWGWQMGRHVWIGGHWEAPPRAGAYWVPHHWDHDGRGWRLSPGYWGRR